MLEVSLLKNRIYHKHHNVPLRALFKVSDPLESILPDNVRAVTGNDDDLLFFLELPHGVYTIPWSDYYGYSYGTVREGYQLALPHILFAVQRRRTSTGMADLRSFCPFFMTQPFTSLDQTLYMPTFPNCYTNGGISLRVNRKDIPRALNVCHTNVRLPTGSNELLKLTSHAFRVFFGEAFNHGGAQDYQRMAQLPGLVQISSAKKWALATKKDPSFILRLPWENSGLTVRWLMDEHRKGQPMMDLARIGRGFLYSK